MVLRMTYTPTITSFNTFDDRKKRYHFNEHIDAPFMRHANRIWMKLLPTIYMILIIPVVAILPSAIVQYPKTHTLSSLDILILVVYVLLTIVGIPGFFAAIYYLQKRAVDKHKIYCLSKSECPACISDMHGQPVEDDGCVVCPKCGAAWKLTDRVSQP